MLVLDNKQQTFVGINSKLLRKFSFDYDHANVDNYQLHRYLSPRLKLTQDVIPAIVIINYKLHYHQDLDCLYPKVLRNVQDALESMEVHCKI